MKRYLRPSLFFWVLLTFHCVGTEVGNPPATTIEIDFVDYKPATTDTFGSLFQEHNLKINTVLIAINSVQFIPCKNGANRQIVSYEKPILVDLFSKNTVEGQVSLDEGKYCKIILTPVIATDDLTSNPDMLGKTLLAQGTYKNQPISLDTDSIAPIRFAGRFTSDNTTSRVFLAFDIRTWFRGIALSNTTAKHKKIIVNAENNRNQYRRWIKNYSRSFRAAIDANHDKKLDCDEIIIPNNEDDDDDDDDDD